MPLDHPTLPIWRNLSLVPLGLLLVVAGCSDEDGGRTSTTPTTGGVATGGPAPGATGGLATGGTGVAGIDATGGLVETGGLAGTGGVVGTGGLTCSSGDWAAGDQTITLMQDGIERVYEASHGFVVVASNLSTTNSGHMRAGLDWLIEQNRAGGDYQGNLATDCAASVGYSWGGGAAVDAGSHPNVIMTISFHGLEGAAENLHGPLLLFTSTGDTFVSAEQFVTPTFNCSTVQTFYATLFGGSHLTPTGDADGERAPAVAWLRLWAYGDQAAREYFHGDDCTLCSDPWTNPQRKNWPRPEAVA